MAIKIEYTSEFVGEYNKLEEGLQEEIREKLELFRDHKNHASLKVHKLHGRLSGYFSFSVNYRYRVIFKYTEKSTTTLITVGDHDIYN